MVTTPQRRVRLPLLARCPDADGRRSCSPPSLAVRDCPRGIRLCTTVRFVLSRAVRPEVVRAALAPLRPSSHAPTPAVVLVSRLDCSTHNHAGELLPPPPRTRSLT